MLQKEVRVRPSLPGAQVPGGWHAEGAEKKWGGQTVLASGRPGGGGCNGRGVSVARGPGWARRRP